MGGFLLSILFAFAVAWLANLAGQETGALKIAEGCKPEGSFVVNNVNYSCKAKYILLDGRAITIPPEGVEDAKQTPISH
uniref:Uncharacterized protein n=1 Tax=Pseudomonas phage Arace01 TaxID=3138526 RepID=A0AAU6VZ79_9VIRU